MNIIKEFVQKVLETEKSFNIEVKEDSKTKRYYHFMQDQVGKARYVYGEYYFTANFSHKLDNKYKLVAIVKGQKVYLVDWYMLIWNYYEETLLPKNTVYLSSKEYQRNFEEITFPKFYDELPINEKMYHDDIRCKLRAREYIVKGVAPDEKIEIPDILTQQDVANDLCEIKSLSEVIEEYLEKNRDAWINTKTFNAKIKEFMKNPDILKPWEKQLAESIRDLDAKFVTVTFQLNGKQAYGKINPELIRSYLINETYFSDWNFQTTVMGEKLYKALGASDFYRDKSRRLFCDNIIQIKYGKKILYTKEI